VPRPRALTPPTRTAATATTTLAPVTALAVVLALLTVLAGAAPARAEGLSRRLLDPVAAARVQAQRQWQQVVTDLARAARSADPVYGAADAASALWLAAQTHGWQSAEIPALVAAVAATANPDGGYGLSQRWDAFQDGTLNPADTSYNATTAGHVGPVLLAGYLAGAVPSHLLTRAIDSILDMPRSFGGSCVPYSNSRFDLHASCVWNVHFGAVAFATAAGRATGWRQADIATLTRAALTWLPRLAQNPTTGYWAYSSAGGGPQDIGHQLWTATAVDYLNGNNAALTFMLGRQLWRTQAARFHDYNVAASMSGIALINCRYATDPTVLAYAGVTTRGAPYAIKAMSAQASQVVHRCFASAAGTAGRIQVLSLHSWPVTGTAG
jgi:hypothetical protein